MNIKHLGHNDKLRHGLCGGLAMRYSPQFVVDDKEAPVLKEGEQSDKLFAHRHPLQILIAEDNYVNRRLLVTVLSNLGYKAVAVENGRECLQAIERSRFDILLTDLDMPEMGGLECTQRLRAAGHTLSIVAVTASCPELSREECLAAGMTDYMRKPIGVTNLKRILREAALRSWLATANANQDMPPLTPPATLAA